MDETNLLSLIRPWLDTNCQITTKFTTVSFCKKKIVTKQALKLLIVLSENRQRPRWKKPAEGILKLNSDGAFREASKDGGWGFVIRNHQGRVIRAGAGRDCRNFFTECFPCWIVRLCCGVAGSCSAGNLSHRYWNRRTPRQSSAGFKWLQAIRGGRHYNWDEAPVSYRLFFFQY
jgi:hypothetical protein